MPTYQYRCPSCGHEFEEFQSMSEEPIHICPACGGETKRIISGGAGFIFKGSGFYVNDYKRKETSASSEAKERSASEATSKAGSKSDSKSDSTSTTKSDTKPKASA